MPKTAIRKRASSTAPKRRKGYHYDAAAAARAVAFFREVLRHTKGEWAGQPFALEPWQQRDVIEPLFGWKRPDGTRKYRTVYIEVPRKNGKSTLAAGIGLYLTFADGEPGAEVYSAAADREQAAIVFDTAKGMIEAEPELASRSTSFRRSIVVQQTGSSYKVLSADAPTKHGLHAHGVIVDELHAQPNRDLYDVLVTSTGARRQPVVFMITTAGYDRHSICWELHDYALKVRDGIVTDESFLPVIFAAGAEDDWTAEATWRKANPGLGTTVKLEYLQQECGRAQEMPAAQNTFRRLHLNQWTEQADRWLDMTVWDRNATAVADSVLLGRECYAGLDASTTGDVSALGLIFPLDDGRFALRSLFWIPEENIRRRAERDRVPYDVWVREDLVRATPGNVVDYAFIRAAIQDLTTKYQVKEIAYDPWNVTQLVTQLQDDGATMVEFRQGFASMSGPTKEFEKLLLGGRLLHGGNPVLRWMASNVAVKQDPAGNLKPDKASSTERIDGIVAAIMALGRAVVQPDGGWDFSGFDVSMG